MAALALGEASTPFLGLWWLAKRAQNGRLARPLSWAFALTFLSIRLGVMPPYVAQLIGCALRGDLDDRCGGAGRARLYAALAAVAVVGGFVWSRSLIRGWR